MGTDEITDLATDHALLLAVAEQVAKSMNGRAARRLTFALEDLTTDPEWMEEDDQLWVEEAVAAAVKTDRVSFWRGEIDRLRADGVTVMSCVDAAYPTNLAMTHDRPPLLFVRGSILDSDVRSVAVVGAREASEEGIKLAGDLATELASTGVTIVSGMAYGIDTAAHSAALNAGGRTIAVYGTTIDKVYPAKNKGLAREIAKSGACVSQFLTTTSPGRWAFPVRNITTSGLSVGTIVVEAKETSGARSQAEAAIAHGKRVFLVERLVTRQPWAEAMAHEPTVTVAGDAQTILDALEAELASTADLVL